MNISTNIDRVVRLNYVVSKRYFFTALQMGLLMIALGKLVEGKLYVDDKVMISLSVYLPKTKDSIPP